MKAEKDPTKTTLKTSLVTKISGLMIMAAGIAIASAGFNLIGQERLGAGLLGLAVGLIIIIRGYQRVFARVRLSSSKIAEIKTFIPKGRVIQRDQISHCFHRDDEGGARYKSIDFISHQGERILTISDGTFRKGSSKVEAWAEANGIPVKKPVKDLEEGNAPYLQKN